MSAFHTCVVFFSDFKAGFDIVMIYSLVFILEESIGERAKRVRHFQGCTNGNSCIIVCVVRALVHMSFEARASVCSHLKCGHQYVCMSFETRA